MNHDRRMLHRKKHCNIIGKNTLKYVYQFSLILTNTIIIIFKKFELVYLVYLDYLLLIEINVPSVKYRT